jgi:Multicopper oxidase
MAPGRKVRLAMRFTDPDSPYMYHCHLLQHEDSGMMGQFVVVEPGSGGHSTPRLLLSPDPPSDWWLYAAKRGSRPRIGVTGEGFQSTPQCRRRHSRLCRVGVNRRAR